jgi:hypothetical protein
MSINNKKLYELFEVNFAMQRQNPDGTSPFLKGYLLGFAGTVNILEAIDPATKTGVVKIKVGNGAVQAKTVNFSTTNPASLTPSAAAQALTNASFTGCSFGVDPETNRLKLAPQDSAVKWIQIYGDVAAALHFGNCRYAQGRGCYLWPSFDGDLKSVAESEQWGEETTIENDSPTGAPVKYIKPGSRTGTQIVITDRVSSRAAKQMINGGKWFGGSSGAPEVYEPPEPADKKSRRLDVFTYSEIYEKNNNTEGDQVLIRERMYIGCVGRQTRTGGAGSWSDSEYTLTAASYKGDDGAEHASPRETDYTIPQWETLQMAGVLEGDWENA